MPHLSFPLRAGELTLLTLSNLMVTELAHPIPGVDVLIGMDVLLACRLIVDGPARQFALEF